MALKSIRCNFDINKYGVLIFNTVINTINYSHPSVYLLWSCTELHKKDLRELKYFKRNIFHILFDVML